MFKTLPAKNQGKIKGCLLVGLVIIFVSASAFYFLTSGIREAKRGEQVLIDGFGWADEYTPSIDGSIDPQRMESFIRVREAVQDNCTVYQSILNSIDELEKLDSDEEISAADATSTGIKSFKSIFSAGPKMIEFSEARNQALLTENMGLGEYIYIYLTVYADQLVAESTSPFSNRDEAYVSKRTREEYTQILTNQVQALEASGQQPSQLDLLANLQLKIDALKNGSNYPHWPNEAAGARSESVAPYQARLENLYCSGIIKMELLQKNRGFQLDG